MCVLTDANIADTGNYTCEVRGRKSLVLDKVTHRLRVRGVHVSSFYSGLKTA